MKDDTEYDIKFTLFSGEYYKGDNPGSVWHTQNTHILTHTHTHTHTQITSDRNTASLILNSTAIICCTAFIIAELFQKFISLQFKCVTKFSTNVNHTSPNLTSSQPDTHTVSFLLSSKPVTPFLPTHKTTPFHIIRLRTTFHFASTVQQSLAVQWKELIVLCLAHAQ